MLKSILVHLRGRQGDTAVLAAACEAARPFAAHLECLHVRPNPAELASQAAATGAEDASPIMDVFEALQRESIDSAARARQAFAEFVARKDILRAEIPPGPAGLNAAFRETQGRELDALITESRYHDLAVVKGGGESAGGLGLYSLGRLLVGAGRPVLIAPAHTARPFRTAVIAWKDAPESARAVTGAMPLLARAERIYVFYASERDEPVSGYEHIVRLLEWHGLKAESHHVIPGQRDPADAVLEMARAAEADLLVMGAYGRSRLSELILGGFTQTILEDASLPVLMCH